MIQKNSKRSNGFLKEDFSVGMEQRVVLDANSVPPSLLGIASRNGLYSYTGGIT